MTNNNMLFKKIMKFVQTSHIKFHDIRVWVTFAWAITGIIQSKKPHFSHWLPFREGNTKAASKARQFSRWLHNPKIDPMKIYRPFVTKLLEVWAGETIYLALDTTQLWKRFVIIRLALVYCGRAIPLGWLVYRSGSPTVAVQRYRSMIQQVATCLPSDCKIILLADRGFAHIELMKLARQLGWSFRIRLKSDTWIHFGQRSPAQVKTLMPALGQGHFYAHVWLTEQKYGPLHLALAYVITPNGSEKWAIISDEAVGRHTFDEYGLRFNIEENFLDDKSGGFNLESSGLDDVNALSRLCLILAVATAYLVSTGIAVDTLGFRPVVDTHWRRGLSYLQIGWRWCHHALSNQAWLTTFLWLPPMSDFEPAIASWKQFYRPMFKLYSLTWL
ncbi:MAG TPA: transposase [Anaerolineae bacterium]|nr:transposase [Anaerolineae bacterium]